jgi:hypothetical protein
VAGQGKGKIQSDNRIVNNNTLSLIVSVKIPEILIYLIIHALTFKPPES